MTGVYGNNEIAADFARLNKWASDYETKSAIARLKKYMGVQDCDYKDEISLTVKQLLVPGKARGKMKKEYGLELVVNGKVMQVSFNSSYAEVIYVCTLLMHKMGKSMYRGDFLCEKTSSKAWIKNVYNYLFPCACLRFEDWFAQLPSDSGRRVNQGKSHSNRKLAEALPQWLANMCKIESVNGVHGMYYTLGIDADDIALPSDMLYLLDSNQSLSNVA